MRDNRQSCFWLVIAPVPPVKYFSINKTVVTNLNMNYNNTRIINKIVNNQSDYNLWRSIAVFVHKLYHVYVFRLKNIQNTLALL